MPLEMQEVTYTYLNKTPFARKALRGVSLRIEAGEYVGIMGLSGSGKSTLLQMLNGLLLPDSGRVAVDGRDTTGLKKKALLNLRQQVGLVFQHPEAQLFAARVYEEVAFGPRNAQLPPRVVTERVEKALDAVGLSYERYRDRKLDTLSSGEKRRVALAGVLAMNPRYLLLDEPTAGLDHESSQRLLATLKEWKQKRDITVIVVSHHISFLLNLAERVLWLEAGAITMDMPRNEILPYVPALQTMGLDLPAALEVLYRLRRQGWELDQDLWEPVALAAAISRELKSARDR